MADTWRIERRTYDPDLEAWGSWSAIETEIEIDAVDGEYSYEDSDSLTNDTTYQYRVKHVGDDSDWLESNEIIYSYGAGGAEAGITIAAEGEGVRFASGGAEVGISLAAEGSGIKISTGGAETRIVIGAEGWGFRYRRVIITLSVEERSKSLSIQERDVKLEVE